ncbi:NAD-dependent deacylase [Cryomorphaceae bacterium 1068]|nr:NAD-dependent deacylase [Cryomorphaceae bacterium 1068]
MDKKKLVVFSGAGMSAESGIDTFRDHGGLWENHKIEEVATPEAFRNNPKKVLDFYNMRFEQLKSVKPNEAHLAIAQLEIEEIYNVKVVTQNVDDLHERAGSKTVYHLHGELTKCKSSGDESYVTEMPSGGLQVGDLCPSGFQLRPNIVWFGEMVTAMDKAVEIVTKADVLVVIGTSLNVYPAAGLAHMAPTHAQVFLIDPGYFDHLDPKIKHIKKPATAGFKDLISILLNR